MKISKITLLIFMFMLCFPPSDILKILSAQPYTIREMNRLPIPPLLKPVKKDNDRYYFELTAQRGITEFVKGTEIITYGYNGAMLGPTIRAKRGQHISIKVKNNLREFTTIHWHGILLPGEMDGGPHQVIPPDKEWTASYTINQPASTAWYHPHGLGNTAIQVYKGLAGLFITDDEESEKLNLPDKYGINDIPLIVQDKRITGDGVPLYLTSMRDIMTGMTGNTILVNGKINPYLEVSSVKYRFRLLNGSNARVYEFRLSDDSGFYQIATDGGLVEKPVSMRSLVLSPGERSEIIVDFSGYAKGDRVSLLSDPYEIIQFRVTNKISDKIQLPEKLAVIDYPKRSDSKRSRVFRLEGMGYNVRINGRQMDINRIDEYIKYNDTEIWTITSRTGGMMGMGMMRGMMGNVLHNYHAHGIHFIILDRN